MPQKTDLEELYERLSAADSRWHIDSGKYKTMIQALAKVNRTIAEYGSKTLEKETTEDAAKQLAAIREDFSRLYAASTEYLQGKGEVRSSVLGTERLLMAKKLQELSGMDMDALSNAKLETDKPVSELIAAGRRITMDVSNKQLDTVGANMSSRIRIKDEEKGLDGFFTAVTSAKSLKEEHARIVKKHCEKNPRFEEYIRFLGDHETEKGNDVYPDDATVKTLWDIPVGTFILYKETVQEAFEQGVKNAQFNRQFSLYEAILRKAPGVTDEKLGQLKASMGFRTALFDFSCDIAAAVNQATLLAEAKIPEKANLDRRNVAMSVTAGLIGCPDIVAHSRTMTLKDGEKETQGVFMENARGLDYAKYKQEPRFFRGNVFDTPEAKMQLADMQVLDFICANTDRHGANMFYEFTPGTDGTPRLTKLTGIDNDCSFGKLEAGNSVNKMPKWDQMSAMREPTALAVLNLTEDTLRYALHGLLTEEEITKAWERTAFLQKKIDLDRKRVKGESFEIGGENIVLFADGDWEEVPLRELGALSENYFNNLEEITRDLAEYLKKNPELASEAKAVEEPQPAPEEEAVEEPQPAPEAPRKPAEVYSSMDELTKKLSCEMIYEENGASQSIQYVQWADGKKPFYRLTEDGKIEAFHTEMNGDRVELYKNEAEPKALESYDLGAAGAAVSQMLRTLVAVDPKTMISSAEFREMKKSIVRLDKEFERYAIDGNAVPDPMAIQERIADARAKAERYLQVKEVLAYQKQQSGGALKETTRKRVDAARTVLHGLDTLACAKLGDPTLKNETTSRALKSVQSYFQGVEDLSPSITESHEKAMDFLRKEGAECSAEESKVIAEMIVAMSYQSLHPNPSEESVAGQLNAIFSDDEKTKSVLSSLSAHVDAEIVSNKPENVTDQDAVRALLEDPKRIAKLFKSVQFEFAAANRREAPAPQAAPRQQEQAKPPVEKRQDPLLPR